MPRQPEDVTAASATPTAARVLEGAHVVGERGWSAAASSLSGRGSLQEVDDPVAASRERSVTACSLLTPPPAAVVQELIGGLGADVAIGAGRYPGY
jgi:hypothetical protein